jgi:hypothetical protein
VNPRRIAQHISNSPLDFWQRFTGTFDDRRTIQAVWEISHDGERWEHDFEMTYVKATQ